MLYRIFKTSVLKRVQTVYVNKLVWSEYITAIKQRHQSKSQPATKQ